MYMHKLFLLLSICLFINCRVVLASLRVIENDGWWVLLIMQIILERLVAIPKKGRKNQSRCHVNLYRQKDGSTMCFRPVNLLYFLLRKSYHIDLILRLVLKKIFEGPNWNQIQIKHSYVFLVCFCCFFQHCLLQ